MGWRCLCWPISWSRAPDEQIDYQTIGEDFHYSEEKGAVFGLGLWMRDLEACFQSGTYNLLKFNNSLERRKWGRVCHVLEPYTRTTETHQTLWIQRNNCFSISDVYSAGVIQRGWISRLPYFQLGVQGAWVLAMRHCIYILMIGGPYFARYFYIPPSDFPFFFLGRLGRRYCLRLSRGVIRASRAWITVLAIGRYIQSEP